MTKHDHALGQPAAACPACKKVINNYVFIKNLAPLFAGPEALALAVAAVTFGLIADGLGIKPNLDGFTGCEQGQTLAKWKKDGVPPDTVLMQKWTAEIWDAIIALAEGSTA